MSSVARAGAEAGPVGRMRAGERRAQLIRVAISLFAQKGFRGTTTKEIALAAGVTEALIFRHFPTKEALYEAILNWKLEESGAEAILARLRELADARRDRDLLRTLTLEILRFYRANPEFQRLMLYAGLEGHSLAEKHRERFVKRVHEFLADYISTRQREGAFREFDPMTAVGAIVAMPLHQSLQRNVFPCAPPGTDDERLAEQYTDMVLSGLLRPVTSARKDARKKGRGRTCRQNG